MADDQGSLFGAADDTYVAPPDAEIRAALVQQGDTIEGRRKIFVDATIRQIKLAYGWEEHRSLIKRLDVFLEATGLKNYSEALPNLLAQWEQRTGRATR